MKYYFDFIKYPITGKPICNICNKEIIGDAAISRITNEDICTSCARNEAMEDY